MARPTVSADLDGVAAVVAADDLADIGEVHFDTAFLADMWSRGAFDISDDSWVVVRDGTIVGYAESVREEPAIVESWGVVHPEHRARGIGGFFLDRIEDRAATHLAEATGARLRHSTTSTDTAASAMVSARGFNRVRHFWHMRIDLEDQPPATQPPGLVIRAVDPDRDLAALHGVLVEPFAQDEFRRPIAGLAEWHAEQIASPSYDPSLWFVALDGDLVLGALTAGDQGGRGWVNEVGVRRAARGRGIGAGLLRASFAEFSRRGITTVMLNVDAQNPTGATILYERVGMRVARAWDLWEKPADR